jgi:hypothetical protein
MNSFCTLFDSNYLTRFLAMHASMVATGESFSLYALCLDQAAGEILEQMALPGLVVIDMAEFENPTLARLRKTRTRAEYCWTCASSLIRYVLDRYRLDEVTYLDADLYFYRRPSLLLEQFRASGGSVLLTEHRFSPQLARDIRFGRFCVQFMTFRNDGNGRAALDWWVERCLEWCHARLERGKFGDQKYLDDWLERFAGVQVSPDPGAGVANWNLQQYRLTGSPAAPEVDGVPVVFYHFHSLKIYRNGLCDMGYKPLSPEAVALFYLPYLKTLSEAEADLAARLPGFAGGRLKNRHPLAHAVSYLLRKPRGVYNVQRLL